MIDEVYEVNEIPYFCQTYLTYSVYIQTLPPLYLRVKYTSSFTQGINANPKASPL